MNNLPVSRTDCIMLANVYVHVLFPPMSADNRCHVSVDKVQAMFHSHMADDPTPFPHFTDIQRFPSSVFLCLNLSYLDLNFDFICSTLY